MSILNIILIGVGLAMDAFAVTVAKSLSVKDIKKKEILTIAGVFGLFQGVMPLLGWLAGIKFESYITAVDHWIAFGLLAIIGGKMVYESLKGEEEADNDTNLEIAVASNKSRFTFKNLFILGVATSIDALAVGVSFAFLNVSIVSAVVIIALTTFILCIAAVYIGKIFGSLIQKKAELFGGIILILIGIKILLEHIFLLSHDLKNKKLLKRSFLILSCINISNNIMI